MQQQLQPAHIAHEAKEARLSMDSDPICSCKQAC
jgi:hypothetical protein